MITLRISALLLLPLAVACSVAPSTGEDAAESTSNLEQAPAADDAPAYTCTGSVKNPSCDVQPFIANAWALFKENPIDNGVNVAGAAADCIGTLVAAGFLAYGSGGAAPIVLTVAGAWEAITKAAACYDTLEYLNTIGVLANLDCAMRPEINTPAENVCECTYACNSGVEFDVDRGYTGMTKYTYGFLDRIGSANCHCTNDSKAVSCQLNCRTWASSDSNDCTCTETF
jgi:hypothetical protein